MAYATVPARHHGSLGWTLPATLGVVYGFYAAFVQRAGGAVTGGQVVLGVVAGVAVAAVCMLLGRVQHALPRELRAAAYGTLTGCALGFLYSLSHASILKSTGMGIVFGGAALAASFFIFYTRET
ncbi:hypothetical protein QMK19_04215 [Streptomyces sp. H10-C2]|uniref:hypothetical protein n=1 Tax=unclassified Streptomyces TaxID=2593676 RepID=UPI0024BA06A8|nr:MULTISPECIES: hypothetical protein [unclassified Streptomyces]MDJ0343516.1 hypothetical protein [Streptomyces sp. PH10-H1]MDJ0368908.1 hypothetical protein [Streptomyces sp. H10-C2]